jgi:8-oxo-dGTP pyrophosphatase MutT (NUDIX family)
MTERLVQVAGVVLLRDDGAALLQHRDDKPGLPHADMWVPPGGHCTPDESIEDCARREFHEETGYRCDGLKLVVAFRVDHVSNSAPLWLTIFWARYDGDQRLVCGEGQALEFVGRDVASMYRIPEYLLEVWDLAVEAAQRERSGA